jgi:hypothetical protein
VGDRQSSRNDTTTAEGNDNVIGQMELKSFGGATDRRSHENGKHPKGNQHHIGTWRRSNDFRASNTGSWESPQYPDSRGAKSDTRYIYRS